MSFISKKFKTAIKSMKKFLGTKSKFDNEFQRLIAMLDSYPDTEFVGYSTECLRMASIQDSYPAELAEVALSDEFFRLPTMMQPSLPTWTANLQPRGPLPRPLARVLPDFEE